MFIGVARLVIQIPGARNLKDRRRVVRALKDRIRARLGVSVAEVGDVERYQVATLGVAVVARESARCRGVLAEVRQLASVVPDALLADATAQVIPFGSGGRGLPSGIELSLGDGCDSREELEDDDAE